MVGESIYITVPVSNDFNTSLRLKRSHLLWKFTPEDGGETFSNDKQDNKSPPYVKVYQARNEYFLFKKGVPGSFAQGITKVLRGARN